MKKTFLLRRPLVAASLIVVTVVLAVALAGPFLAPHDPLAINQNSVNQPSSAQFLLGTDEFGRDILSRLLIGIRPTMLVAVVSTIIAAIGGTACGIVGAYSRPALAFFMMRGVDIMLSFPAILLALLAVGFWRSGVVSLSVVIGIIFIPQFARVAQSATLQVIRQEFVEAEHAMGARYLRVVLRAILPNILSPLVVQATLTIAAAILLESGLSFLGLGIVPPEPSWGQMIGTARGYLSQNPMYVVWPSVCLALTVLAINVLGDALRDYLDPRLREN
ncbi:ABC transporter permease [Rhizobium rhizogenes]|uniref:ABC transporter permease protein n=1 Tax=Rhizobium rhizogenes NBRC 13257 TaxID=1220581 RepID=A0AA87QC24_RHIRH|nr:ABC transporter permease [Rhizobium rhizogenes]NTG71403.1 ABC transporter permease [Rhizobium rhizogenes]TRB05080.1 ABC transporter permease [Rhizobium rhizogenes]TRB39337.1 ABC transporter permease [Rhizobium rhizogenes]TRB54615.1 ABC transporter permease [Rhizobium rhizogenes]GAJ95509.1 putative ABC transporter permease protein [Rhizobium rhizogenes NBRC 13257]